jgi:arylsulfatase A-like enzyme/cytochrome c-type biogenesis protein CcmH/NrfG
LITIDTLRADALGIYGRRQARTPWIDQLATAGVRFDRARAQTVVTLPSHANILAGRYPFDHGVRDNAGFRFPESIPTLATILKARGFRTGAFVSAFPLDSRFGLDRGFDVYDDGFGGAGTQRAFLVQERAGRETVARAVQWLDAQKDAPVLCWVHVYEPHFPYAPPEPLATQFRGSLYDGEVAAADLALRPLIEPALDSARRSDTLVVLTSDHGEALGEHGEATHGIFGYEATLRVPLVVYQPNRWRPAIVSTPVAHVDIMPTILDALALPVPADIDGRSLVPLLNGGTEPSRSMYFEAMSGMLNRGWAPLQGLVRDEIKFVDLPIPELYNLGADPEELHNLAGEQPQRVEELRSELRRLPTAVQHAARVEDSDTRERLRSLGYASGTAARRDTYNAADDPKRLVTLDRLLEEVVARYIDGDRSGALERCRELVQKRPTMAVSWLYLAHLERESGRIDAGIAALEKAASLNGNDSETLALLGAYLTEGGRARDAVERLKPHAARADPDVGVLISYGLALARIGDIPAAVAALARAQQIDPGDAMLHVHLGTIELIGNNRERARTEFEAALALAPDLPRAHSSLGVVLAEEGRFAEAVTHWDRAGTADPREYRPVLGVGLSLARRGNVAGARPYLEYFVSRAPTSMYRIELDAVRTMLSETRNPKSQIPNPK